MNIDPPLPIRTERLLLREIAKIPRQAFPETISAKTGFPEFARINAETSIEILSPATSKQKCYACAMWVFLQIR